MTSLICTTCRPFVDGGQVTIGMGVGGGGPFQAVKTGGCYPMSGVINETNISIHV